MASTGVASNGVSELPPSLTLLHEQTDHSLHQMIKGAIPFTLLDPFLTNASSVQSVPSAPTRRIQSFHAKPHRDIDVFVKYGQDGLIKSGTLPGLIKELLVNSGGGKVYIDYKTTFLTLYPAFTTGDEVLQLLFERLQAVAPLPIAEQSSDVRFSVILLLEFWLEEDNKIAINVQLLQQMRELAVFVQASSTAVPVFSHRAQKLVESIEKILGMSRTTTPPLTASTLSLPDRPSPQEFPALDLAHVLTSIEGERYRKLKELDYVYWLEGNQESNAVSSFIAENRKLSYWAERSILRSHHESQRAENLKYFLRTIVECKLLHNFSSACALSAGVTTAAITGLKRTCDLDRKSENLFRDAQRLISLNEQFTIYRTTIKKTKNACIPWLYVHLHDLKMVHRAYPDLVDEDGRTKLINFERCRRVHHRIRQIRGYEPSIPVPPNPHHTALRTLVDAEINAMIINEQHCNWAQRRGEQLAAEEQKSYDTHDKELVQAGFVTSRPSARPTLPERVPPAQHPRHRTSSVSIPLTPLTPQNTPVPPTPGPGDRQDVHVRPLLTDVFNRDSEQCLDNRITRENPYPVASGGYADIYQGIFGGQKVAIKSIRHFSSSGGRLEEPRLLKRLWREYAAWTWVSHPIVLKCLGFTYDFSPENCLLPSLISPWMSNGTLRNYIRNHPETNRLKILLDVANGLSYLHEQNPAIVHGDIRGDNILISDSGSPCLSDFGLSKVLKLEGMTATSSEVGGSLRWMSPELFHDNLHSTKSDVWAYAMTVLEIMTGQPPYAEIKNDVATLRLINQGQMPLRSVDFTNPQIIPDDVWAICQKCWNLVPKQRPSMQVVFSEFNSVIDGGT